MHVVRRRVALKVFAVTLLEPVPDIKVGERIEIRGHFDGQTQRLGIVVYFSVNHGRQPIFADALLTQCSVRLVANHELACS